MGSTSIEQADCAKAILTTYHQVNDTPGQGRPAVRTKLNLQQKNKALEHELNDLKEKYQTLQNELNSREKRLASLNQQLVDSSQHMARLQEDFENAIYQLTRK